MLVIMKSMILAPGHTEQSGIRFMHKPDLIDHQPGPGVILITHLNSQPVPHGCPFRIPIGHIVFDHVREVFLHCFLIRCGHQIHADLISPSRGQFMCYVCQSCQDVDPACLWSHRSHHMHCQISPSPTDPCDAHSNA